MSAAVQSISIENSIRAALVRATILSGRTDSWFAERIGCSREQFNGAKHGRRDLSFSQVVRWSVLAGVPIVAVQPQQAEAAE